MFIETSGWENSGCRRLRIA